MSQGSGIIISEDSKKQNRVRAVHKTSVILRRHGKEAVFLLSESDFKRLAEALDDMWWGARAMEAMKEGTIGVAKSMKYINSVLRTKRGRRTAQ